MDFKQLAVDTHREEPEGSACKGLSQFVFQWSLLFASHTNKTNAQITEVCLSRFSLGEAGVTMNPKLSVHDNKLLFLIQLAWVYYGAALHYRM